MKLILTHPNADFDAVAASLAAHKLYPDAIPLLPDRLNYNVDDFLMLYRSGLPFVFESDLHDTKAERVILVDTQRLPKGIALPKRTPVEIIDHHQPYTRDDLQPQEQFLSETVGAATTILVERIQQRQISLSPLEATLLALGIYEDTGSLSYGTTTARDIRAAAWLLEQQASLDTVRRFLSPPLNEAQQALFDRLMDQSEDRSVRGHSITVAHARVDEHVSEISSVVHRLRDVLDSSAIFVLVQMPNHLVLICRSTADAVDCGKIARHFGGGGHDRAAAATIYDQKLEAVLPALWEQIQAHVRPLARVETLMSHGVQTLDVNQSAREVARQMRQIGHEGFPVLDNGRIVGLLTRRELDRALEHGLDDISLRDIMNAGEVMLHPGDSVHTLEQTMVESGWGQIPVVDDQGKLLGIVTRTDLIQHWASAHPAQAAAQRSISPEEISTVLGPAVGDLVERVAVEAQAQDLNLFMVGGAVRDLLLQRPNLDLDFVVEGSAIDFVAQLQARYGGERHVFKPFGTAKWLLDDPDLPPHIDFASARNEFYEHPTALPTVYQSSIKLDLQRRDFTVNTLTIQLSPAAVRGRVLDFYGGLADLQAGILRVLHSLSFVDDPTRILRAFRFENRLGFSIEARTAELITAALPMLPRVTGERLRNELTLLLEEDHPALALRRMESLGILRAIHPAFVLAPDLEQQLQAAQPSWAASYAKADLSWHLLAAAIPLAELDDFCERLMFGRHLSDSLRDAARLAQRDIDLGVPELRPSQIVDLLDPLTEIALLTAWLIDEDGRVRERIDTYLTRWRDITPLTTGHDLLALGLKPGPCFRAILSRLRQARSG